MQRSSSPLEKQCRSRWCSGDMFDCGVWEPVIESHHELEHYCIFDSHCNMQLWDTLTYCCIELNTEMYSLLLVLQKNWLCSCYISTEFRMQCCCWLRLQLALSMFFACSHWTLLAAAHCLTSFSCAHRQKCKLASALSLILNFQVNKCTVKEKNPTFLNFRNRHHCFSEMSQLLKHYRAFWLFVNSCVDTLQHCSSSASLLLGIMVCWH